MHYPCLNLYTGDWKKDPELSACSPATRGVWIDLICTMHDASTATLIGTPEQLARLSRCSASEMHLALDELSRTRTARLSERDGVYTVTCRRLQRKQELSKKRSESGSKGAAKRRQSERRPENEVEEEVLRIMGEFCTQHGIPCTDATSLFHKWEGNGWTNGGEPIVDWRSTILSWQRHGYLPSQRQKQTRFNLKTPDPRKEKSDREEEETREKLRQFYAKKGISL